MQKIKSLSLSIVGAVIWVGAASDTASAYVPVGCPQVCYYTPGRITNATYGDTLAYAIGADYTAPDVVKQVYQQMGISYSHVAIVSDWGGSYKTEQNLNIGQGYSFASCGAPIPRPWIHNMLPGTSNNIAINPTSNIRVLHSHGNGSCTGSTKYRIYGFLSDSLNGQCAQFLNDSCGIPSNGMPFGYQQVEYAKTLGLNEAYNYAMGYIPSSTRGHYFTLTGIGCGGDDRSTVAWRGAWQLANEVIHLGNPDQGYQVGGGYDNYNYAPVAASYWVPAYPDGVVSAYGAAPELASIVPGYYTCYDDPSCSGGSALQ